jgi:hypothetical protein
MVPVIEEVSGMSEVQRLIGDSGISTLELTVYYKFKCYAVYDPNSVWATRELQENENPHKPSFKFLCSMRRVASFFKDNNFGRLAVEMIAMQWARKTVELADIEVMMVYAPQLDTLIKDRICKEGIFFHSRESMDWVTRFQGMLPCTFTKFTERAGPLLEEPAESQPEAEEENYRHSHDNQKNLEDEDGRASLNKREEYAYAGHDTLGT